ncbi:hypothetical protein D1007_15145 [Hordeum vulgare]|nr:hypothetical protein D1007_15145 [Hordeum vulgare]
MTDDANQATHHRSPATLQRKEADEEASVGADAGGGRKVEAKSAKRRNRRAVPVEKKAAAEYTVECSLRCALQQHADLDDKESIFSKAHALLMLSMSLPMPANLYHAAVAAVIIGSSAHRLPHRSPSASVTQETSDVCALSSHGHGQTRFSMSPDCVVVDPNMPVGVIDLNITPRYSGTGHCEDGVQRKQHRSFVSAHMARARKLFDDMPSPTHTTRAEDLDYATVMQNIIFEGHGEAIHVHGQEQAFDPDKTQSQDDCGTKHEVANL